MDQGDIVLGSARRITRLLSSTRYRADQRIMAMTPGVRKFALSAHLTCSVGWIGTVVAYLALGFLATNSRDVAEIRGAWTAMEVIGWYVTVPLAVASFFTGLLMALGTRWGLFRHYWVLISFVLTLFATAVLVLHMPTVSSTAEVARTAEGDVLQSLGGDLFHPAVGLVILLVVQVLNLYKPRGVTPYGWRKQQQQQSGTPQPGGKFLSR